MRDGIELNSYVSYDDQHHEFTFPFSLPANWSGQIELSGFRTRTGIAAGPITIQYSTGAEALSQDDLDRLLRPESLAKLRKLVEDVRTARNSLQSVSETVHSVSYRNNIHSGRGFSQLDGNWSRFKMQGQRQFYGDVSQVMGMPFQIGSDGAQCWFYSQRPTESGEKTPTLITCKYEDIPRKQLAYVKPFDSDPANLQQVVKDRRLEYLGLEKINGTDCHLVQALDVEEFGGDHTLVLMIFRWWIDSHTLRPLQLAVDYSTGRSLQCFRYDSVNQRLPIAEFQPTVAPQTVRQGPEPLGAGYDTRFLKLSDGTNGRMSCRWGKTGTSGRSSSGLN